MKWNLSLVLALTSAAAFGQNTIQPERLPSAPRDAGIYHVASGTWTRVGSTASLGPDVLYRNTAPSGYFGIGWEGSWGMDEGIAPTTSNPNGGTQESYEIDGMRFSYCSLSALPVDLQLTFLDSYVPCDIPDAPANCISTAADLMIPGLPSASACWTVTLDLSGGSEFCLEGDGGSCNPGYQGASLGLDHFGWGQRFVVADGASTGPLLAGDPSWAPSGQGTFYDPALSCSAGATGLGSQDLFAVDGSGSAAPGCYWFGGYNSSNGCGGPQQTPFGSMELELFCTATKSCKKKCVRCMCIRFKNGQTGAKGESKSKLYLFHGGDQFEYKIKPGETPEDLVKKVKGWLEGLGYDVSDVSVDASGRAVICIEADKFPTRFKLKAIDKHLLEGTVKKIPSADHWWLGDAHGDAFPVGATAQGGQVGCEVFLSQPDGSETSAQAWIPTPAGMPARNAAEALAAAINALLGSSVNAFPVRMQSPEGAQQESVFVKALPGNSVSGFAMFSEDDGFDELTVGLLDQASAVGTEYCTPAVPNSTGQSASIGALAFMDGEAPYTPILATATNLPPGEFGFFLTGQGNGVVQPPGSQGLLCLTGSPIGRYNEQIFQVPASGMVAQELSVDPVPLSPPYQVQPGETWNFQAWYRDVNPTSTSNFTSAVAVTFL